MKMNIIDEWREISSEGLERYMTVELIGLGKCDVKLKENGFMYVMESGNGGELYVDIDTGIRNLTKDEYDNVITFAKAAFAREVML